MEWNELCALQSKLYCNLNFPTRTKQSCCTVCWRHVAENVGSEFSDIEISPAALFPVLTIGRVSSWKTVCLWFVEITVKYSNLDMLYFVLMF